MNLLRVTLMNLLGVTLMNLLVTLMNLLVTLMNLLGRVIMPVMALSDCVGLLLHHLGDRISQ